MLFPVPCVLPRFSPLVSCRFHRAANSKSLRAELTQFAGADSIAKGGNPNGWDGMSNDFVVTKMPGLAGGLAQCPGGGRPCEFEIKTDWNSQVGSFAKRNLQNSDCNFDLRLVIAEQLCSAIDLIRRTMRLAALVCTSATTTPAAAVPTRSCRGRSAPPTAFRSPTTTTALTAAPSRWLPKLVAGSLALPAIGSSCAAARLRMRRIGRR